MTFKCIPIAFLFLKEKGAYKVFTKITFLLETSKSREKSHRLCDFNNSSLCLKKSTSRLYFLEKYIPKNLTFGFQFCIFAVLNVHNFNAARSVPTYRQPFFVIQSGT